MNLATALAKLKAQGTAQNVKVYRRHGAGENVYGVSVKDLNALRKAIGVDHDLALKLFATGNADARILATLVADPDALTFQQAEAWLKAIDYYMVSNYLGTLVAKTSFAVRAYKKWSRAKAEFTRHCGYDVLSTLLKNGHAFDRDELLQVLDSIEQQIHKSPNRARNAMNSAVIAIGVYGPGTKRSALAAAKRIGPVEVDHGETHCRTPDAVAYIEKAVAHRKRQSVGKRQASTRSRVR